MENASKALIIAGAILISILLISVGVLIMNSTDGVTGGMASSADSMEMNRFNSQFSSYAGGSKSASQVRTLVSNVISSNATNDAHQVSVTTTGTGFNAGSLFTSGTSASADLSKINQGVKQTYKYTIELVYDNEGYISNITIH